jgi:hypothetical protein
MSKIRLLSSYGSMAAILAFAGWCACFSFPLTGLPQAVAAVADSAGQKERKPLLLAFQAPPARTNRFAEQPARLGSVPVVANPHEPVTGSIQIASSPADRAAALALLERARQNGLTHRAGTEPYRLEATFSAAGPAAYTGQGQMTETWLTGQRWLWTASLGSYSVTRTLGFGSATGEKYPGAVAMRVQVLRNAIFWGIQAVPGNQIRTAAVPVNGRPATCILMSGMVAPTEQTRLWEESEYCIDKASGLVQVHSIAPGTYSIYSYDRNLQFHGRSTPDRIAIYVNGALALDAQVTLEDAGSVDPTQLRPTPEMIAAGPIATLGLWTRFPIDVPSASVSGLAKPVIVHASVDGSGKVVEEELSSASDAALAQTALDVVKNAKFAAGDTQQQMYINVRFVPESR